MHLFIVKTVEVVESEVPQYNKGEGNHGVLEVVSSMTVLIVLLELYLV